MKKLAISIFLAITFVSFVGCNKTEKTSSTSPIQSAVVNNQDDTSNNKNNQTQDNKKVENNEAPKLPDKEVITDIKAWQHPVKDIFNAFKIPVNKVELTKNKTYPVFYVTLEDKVDSEHKDYYENLIKSLAAANGYWDYKVLDENNNISLEVICDKAKKEVKTIIYNGDKEYFSSLKATNDVKSVQDELVNYLIESVPEVKSFKNVLSNNKNGVSAAIYVERMPDVNGKNVYMKNYYGLYVGENHPDHTVNIYRFAINKDTKEILFYDAAQDKYMTLDEWRKARK